jgi:hypothetical protein
VPVLAAGPAAAAAVVGKEVREVRLGVVSDVLWERVKCLDALEFDVAHSLRFAPSYAPPAAISPGVSHLVERPLLGCQLEKRHAVLDEPLQAGFVLIIS